MDFLLLAFYLSVWSVLNVDVLCCRNLRGDSRIPQTLSLEGTWQETLPGKKHLWTLFSCMFSEVNRQQVAFRSSVWPRYACPIHCSFSNRPPPTSSWGLFSYNGGPETHIIWVDSKMYFTIDTLANWPRKMIMSVVSRDLLLERSRSLYCWWWLMWSKDKQSSRASKSFHQSTCWL